ncbi:MAG: carboxypeptidase-like regulatory domain-containing protein [Pyrobaculum sp.]
MHNPKTILLLTLIGLIALTALTYAQSQAGGGVSIPTAPITYNITLQVNTECPYCSKTGVHIFQYTNPHSWAAGKQFTLVVQSLNTTASTFYAALNATANSTGFVTFKLQAPPTVANTWSTWEAALLVNWHGYYFLVYDLQLNGTLADLVANLTGHYYTVLPNGTVVNNYVNINSTNSWGILNATGTANFGNITSAVIHQFYLGINAAGQSYNLTLIETLSISGATVYTWTYQPAGTLSSGIGPYFGPITYLGTYVTALPGAAGTAVTSKLSPSSVQYTFTVQMSIYNAQTGSYVTQNLITSTNGIHYGGFTAKSAPNSTTPQPATAYVIITANFTQYTSSPPSVNATCQQIVYWALPLSTITITGLYDIKGNPILAPEYFIFKVQENIGGAPLTISQQQGGWSTDITDLRFGLLHTLCGGSITSFSDLVSCFNNLNANRTRFAQAVFSIYRPVTVAWISGTISLTDASLSLSSANLSPRLIVEYSYQATPFSGTQQPTSGYIQAVVFQAPLNASSPVALSNVKLTVSVLPVQIPLWWRNNVTLPNGQPFNNFALAQGLTFVLTGTTAYLTETGQYAVVADPWSSQMTGANQVNTLYLWALPPFEMVPVTPGTYMDLLTLFNASGYLPLPTLNAIFTGSGFKYLNWSQAVGLSNTFSQYGLSIGTTQYTYNFRIYAGSVLVGTANVIATYPQVYANGTMVETPSNVASALQAQYGPTVYDDAYTVQAVYYNATAGVYGLQAQKLGFYNLEHAINIAINLKTINFLFRDFCGNVPSVVNGTISLTVIYGNANFTLPSLPVAAEVPVTVPVAVDQWGKPVATTATAYVTLNYFGYRLYGTTSNTAIPTSPVAISFALQNAPYFKPVVYLPIAPATFKVMAAIWTENDSPQQVQEVYLGPQFPLVGFVLVPTSLAPGYVGVRMGESISNASGLAYFDELPLGVPFKMIVRTIDPMTDMEWPFTAAQTLYGNSYSAYAQWLGLSANDYVYTLGTRGPIDAGLVANSTTLTLTTWCTGPQTFEAQVFNPVFRVFDKTGKFLLSSQYVVPGPYPGAAEPILANVTLVVADDNSPYLYASRWLNFTDRDYIVLTDFRAVGMTGMRSLYLNLAQQYLSTAQAQAGCTTTPYGNVSYVATNFAYAAMAGWLANSSTNLYSAVFTLTSFQPKNAIPSICNLTASTVGTYDIARLFLPNMTLHVQVWYMGYKVYDGYVTLTKPTVDIHADVYPVNVTAYTKDLRLPVNSYVGFTLANAYFGIAYNSTIPSTANNFTALKFVKSLLAPFNASFVNGTLKYLLTNASDLANHLPAPYNTKVFYNLTGRYSYFGSYEAAKAGADIIYLPDLFVSRNATSPMYMSTVNVANGTEYLASFDRWLLLQYPAALIRTYDVFERNFFWQLLSGGNETTISFTNPSSGVYTAVFSMYIYNGTGKDLLNYKTLVLNLPWGAGTNATIYVTVTNSSNGYSQTFTYPLSQYSSLPQNLLVYTIDLRDLALQVAKVSGDSNVEVQFNVTVSYSSGPTTSYYMIPNGTLYAGVYGNATYKTVALGTAGTTASFEIVSFNVSKPWRVWGGFGMPVTYIVPSGQVALLPAWATGTAAAGSYISRIWIVAAGSTEALCTNAPNVLGPLTDAKGANIRGYDFFGKTYLVVNYVPASTPQTKSSVPVWSQTNLDEFYDGSGMVAGLGFPIGGTSTLAIDNYTGLPVWNVTALYQAGVTSLSLPTTALDYLTVYNNASFPILVSNVVVSCGSSSYTIPVSAQGGVYVPMYNETSVPLSDYGFGLSYAISASGTWSLDVFRQPYNYSLSAYYGGMVDLIQHFLPMVYEQANRTLSPVIKAELNSAILQMQKMLNNYTLLIQTFNLQPLSSAAYTENVLYASHAESNITGWSYKFYGAVFENGTKKQVVEATAGTWGALTVNSSDYDFKYYFSFPELPLKYILDWNARPLANQTVVLFDQNHDVYAIIFTNNRGQLFYDLPDISFMGKRSVIYVSWFDGYPLSVITKDPAYLIWIYQQDIGNDIYQLGNASSTVEIRTYVYPATLTVYGPNGQPLAGVVVQVYDDGTKGAMFYFNGTTGSTGAVTVYDRLISNYPAGFLSQLPSTNFDYQILYPYSTSTAAAPADAQIWVPVATGTFSIQRGATVPSSGYSITSTVTFMQQLPIAQSGVGASGTFYLQTPQGTVAIPFKTVTVSGTSYIVPSQPIPTSVSYPLTMEVDTVYVNGVPVKLTTPFKASFTTTTLPTSLDLASLGLLAQTTVQAVDGFGKLRTDWPVTISINGQTIASGNGEVTAYLPLSQYVGAYNVTVATTVKTPSGATVVNTTSLTVSAPGTFVVSVPSAVISASVVDAFGTALTSSPIQITNVATGTGSVTAEVLAGTYTVSAQAFGYTWSKSVSVQRGQTAAVQITIPTAKISASVVDQAYGTTGQWPIQIIGPNGAVVASGTGTVSAEVLAQDPTGAALQYNVVANTPFGTYSTGSFAPPAGQTITKTITVPTAILQISAVDDNGYPINNLVSQVDIYYANGTLYKSFSSAPVSVEVLAGQQYTIKVTAQQNHVGSATITPPAGQTVAVKVTVPGTAGITIGGVRIPLPELVLWIVLIIVIVIIVAILLMEYSNWRRRRLMQILAPPK